MSDRKTTFDPEKAFKLIANGNDEAYALCLALYHWAHTVDDLYDRDQEVTPEWWAEINLTLLDMSWRNSFFRQHYPALFPVIRQSLAAWAASEEYRTHEDVRDRVIAEVLKSQYQDIFFEIAFWCGGLAHQRRCDKELREYSFN
jgi:hypothetical protein